MNFRWIFNFLLLLLVVTGVITGLYSWMYNQNLSLEILKTIAQFATVITAVGAIISAYFGARKYFDDKNREFIERRLNEVYAPLYGLLAKQKVLRDIIAPGMTVEEIPIISISHTKTTSKYNEELKEFEKNVEELTSIADKKEFLSIIQGSNMGLASPNLVVLINKYETALWFMNLPESHPERKKVEDLILEIEISLCKEIIISYKSCIKKLGLDKSTEIDHLDVKTGFFN
ncbi:hypothetical protein ORM30_29420 [Bacillus cereus]|uniref:hypothetical protein n=1 Tax=Bacillus TaxID=1386 RepID=UPI0010BE320C|nr:MULTISPECIES: hypothetical protein [Bacillus]MDK3010865.1 hypothetical protein [Bacillus sp. RB3]MDZ4444517.1 hypothetical protein [Bacillus cereus]TKH88689.1 hypothetical protein FC685_13895 [Bacillus cereus]